MGGRASSPSPPPDDGSGVLEEEGVEISSAALPRASAASPSPDRILSKGLEDAIWSDDEAADASEEGDHAAEVRADATSPDPDPEEAEAAAGVVVEERGVKADAPRVRPSRAAATAAAAAGTVADLGPMFSLFPLFGL